MTITTPPRHPPNRRPPSHLLADLTQHAFNTSIGIGIGEAHGQTRCFREKAIEVLFYPKPSTTMNHEILVHVAASTTRESDDRYRRLAAACAAFETVRIIGPDNASHDETSAIAPEVTAATNSFGGGFLRDSLGALSEASLSSTNKRLIQDNNSVNSKGRGDSMATPGVRKGNVVVARTPANKENNAELSSSPMMGTPMFIEDTQIAYGCLESQPVSDQGQESSFVEETTIKQTTALSFEWHEPVQAMPLNLSGRVWTSRAWESQSPFASSTPRPAKRQRLSTRSQEPLATSDNGLSSSFRHPQLRHSPASRDILNDSLDSRLPSTYGYGSINGRSSPCSEIALSQRERRTVSSTASRSIVQTVQKACVTPFQDTTPTGAEGPSAKTPDAEELCSVSSDHQRTPRMVTRPSRSRDHVCANCSRSDEGLPQKFGHCKGCRKVHYCSETCRQADSNDHEYLCSFKRADRRFGLDSDEVLHARPSDHTCASCLRSDVELLQKFGHCRCKTAYYCSKRCERAYWYDGHRHHCRQKHRGQRSSLRLEEPTSSEPTPHPEAAPLDFSRLPEVVYAPPPEDDIQQFAYSPEVKVTEHLLELKNSLPDPTLLEAAWSIPDLHFTGEYTVRGFWRIKTRGWDSVAQFNFWNYLVDFIRSGKAGHDILMIRNVDTSNNTDSCGRMGYAEVSKRAIGLGELRFWCYEAILIEVYCLLLTASDLAVKNVHPEWCNAKAEIVLRM